MAPGRIRAAVALAAALAATLLAPVAAGSTLPGGFRDKIVLSGLEEPTKVRFAANGLVFVAEKPGIILAFDGLDDPTPTEFADVRTEVYDTFDRGLLGLALDPEFPTRPYVYALYTYDHVLGAPEGEVPKWGHPDQSGDGCDAKPAGTGVDACPASGRLVRFTADAAKGFEKAVASGGDPEEKVLVEGWCAQFSSHSIGDLQFGPEGALYASGGEGADANNVDYGKAGWPSKNQCGDPPGGVGGNMEPPSAEGGALRAQDARTPNPTGAGSDPTGLSGSVIRIDPDSGEGWPGNPLSTSLDANERRLVGFGFRNPFRFTIDPVSGELYVGNVGWNRYEEIDRFKPSSSSAYNSGWPCYEGPGPNQSYQSLGLTLCENLYAEAGATAPPFFYYGHGDGVSEDDVCPRQDGSAVSGNALYEGGAFPAEYEGALFFSDPVRGCIYVMRAGADGKPDPATTSLFLSDAGRYPGIDLEVGPGGDLYYVSLFNENVPGDEFGAGAVHRVSYGPHTPFARLDASARWGEASVAEPLEVQLDAGESSDPDEEPLSYEWDLDGDGSFETATAAVDHVDAAFTAAKNVTVAVRARDPGGKADVDRVTIYPGDTPPTPTIEAPSEALTWRVGQPIEFAGAAGDGEDGPLGGEDLFWKTRLYHCPQSAANCHVHPLEAFPGTASGTLLAPDHDFPSRIELTLTAVDSRGLAVSESIQLLASEVDLQLASDPPGLVLTAGVANRPTPFTLPVIGDSEVTLSAPPQQELGGRAYTWQRWSDGGARVHSVLAAGAATYTAYYSTPEAPSIPIGPPVMPAAPRTRLAKHPPKSTSSTSARFEFAADQAGAGFECKLDGAPYKVCRSPRVYRRLAPGQHAMRIRALGAGGTDTTPILFKWKVLPPR